MEFLKKNALPLCLLAVCVIAVLVGGYALLSPGSRELPAPRFQRVLPATSQSQEKMREILYRPPSEPRPTEHDERLAAIEDYRTRLEENPDSEEAPILLLAMGNLQKMEGDCDNAIAAYEQVILNHPKSNQYLDAWLETATCYEIKDDYDNMIRTYMDMTKAFPPENVAHQFALSKLGMSDITVPGPLPEVTPEPEPDNAEYVVEDPPLAPEEDTTLAPGEDEPQVSGENAAPPPAIDGTAPQ